MTNPKFEDYQKMIKTASIKMNRQYPWVPVEEFEAEGNLIFCEASIQWNPERSKFSTYLFHSLKALHNIAQVGCPVDPEFEQESFACGPPETIEFKNLLESLSDEAKEVASVLLNSPLEIMRLAEVPSPKKIRGALRDHLRNLGWQWKTIRSAFTEIERVLEI